MVNPSVDVEFSLALHNRTGKYFIGRDLIADQRESIGDIYYWRTAAAQTPRGLPAKLLGRGMHIEHRLRRVAPLQTAFALRPRRPLLHLDPFTVCHTALRSSDIILCHDLGPITHPALFSPSVSALYQRAYRYIAAIGPRMIFVSKASRDAFVALYGPVPEMRVIYPSIRTEAAKAEREPVEGVTTPFLLTVGSLGNRKNQLRAIEAFARSGMAGCNISYVLCGSREPGAAEVEALAAETAGVTILPYVSDAQLNWLYAEAKAFVLPSLLEGFGIPVAEAISRGLVPLVSRDSVLHEVAGDGALLVDPRDVDDIAAAMRALIDMEPGEMAARRDALAASIKRFSRAAFAEGWRDVVAESA